MLMEMLGGSFSPDKIGDMLSDSEKIKQFLPIISSLADTFKQEGEHTIGGFVSFEDGQPILRVVATSLITLETPNGEKKDTLCITRNLMNTEAEPKPLKFNLLDLLISHNEQKTQQG